MPDTITITRTPTQVSVTRTDGNTIQVSVAQSGIGGNLISREQTVWSTASLAAQASESGTVTLGKGFRVLRLGTNRPARVRLYTTAAKRTADAARPVGTDPTGDHGCLLDVVTTAALLALDLTPAADGYTMENLTAIAYRVQNLDTAAGVVTTTLNWLKTEA